MPDIAIGHILESEMPHSLEVYDVSQEDIDQLARTIREKSLEQICTVSQLRRSLKWCDLLRRVLSSLWLAVIYVSVQKSDLGTITAQLQQAGELREHGSKERMSKYCRAGKAAWHVIFRLGPGVLALVDLAEPVSDESVKEFLLQTKLCSEGILYRQHIHDVFVYLEEFLRVKQTALFQGFRASLEKIRDEILRLPIHSERQLDVPHHGLEKALVLQGLWKDSAEQELVYFYIHSICTSRTLLTTKASNSYELLTPEPHFSGVTWAICCLAASYLKNYIPFQFDRYSNLETKYLLKSVKYLQSTLMNDQIETILKISMLLLHHGVTSTEGPPFQWTMHAKLLCGLQSLNICINYPPAIFIVYQIILNLGRPLEKLANDGVCLEWLLDCKCPDLILDLGLSRRLLYYIGKTTEVASSTIHAMDERERQGMMFKASIAEYVQYTLEPVKEAFEVTMNIGLSYQIAALLMVNCRLLGYTSNHPEVKALAGDLAPLILTLPDGGDLYGGWGYKAQDPLYTTFICALFSEHEYRQRLFSRLKWICRRQVTNVSPSLVVLPILWNWLDTNSGMETVEHGWMERMLSSILPAYENLSLG